MEVTLDDIEVMYIDAEKGPEGAEQAFDKLESHFSTLRGRKFYGTYQSGKYSACVAIKPEDDPSSMGLDTCIIPGGRYIRKKMKNWLERIPEIEQTFIALAKQYPSDPERPSIEFYRSQKELILFLPLLSSG
jgi:hypothetical protein